jgi:acetylornithine deacetylase/succinyl-diaminopimelate desuccinylase-like protein
MKSKAIIALVICALFASFSFAQSSAVSAARTYRQENEARLLNEFASLLAMPNVASDTANIRKNAEYIRGLLQKRGIDSKLLELDDPEAPPVVFGEYRSPGATKTVIFYAHYDGQPTDPADWTVTKPWTPVLLDMAAEKGGKKMEFPSAGGKVDPDWRIYGRSASDDKAGVFTILNAFDALKAAGMEPSVNIKFFFEGEEEAGSSHLGAILAKYKDALHSDAWIICDGPVHQSGRKKVSFGVRGMTTVFLTVYGANRSLHSGHYGNWAPNPGLTLVRLLDSMKDRNGRVTVKGWYDDVEPLGPRELKAIKDAPLYDDELKKQLGLNATDQSPRSLLELISEPSLNINGMRSGDVGTSARNIIPSQAEAVLGLRLVKGNDYNRQIEKLRRHVEAQGFYVIDRDPTQEERLAHPLIGTS